MTGFASLNPSASWLSVFLAMAVGAIATPIAAAQGTSVANTLQGFTLDRHQLVHIKSASLEVRDKAKSATFQGNVHAVQGDTTLRCAVLVVHYEQGGTAPPGGADQQRLDRLEAKGDVIVSQKDRTITGDNGVFDMHANRAVLTGNVVLTQGRCVSRGDRLEVDLSTGVSRLYQGRSAPGGVHAIIDPGGCTPSPPAK